ncbi:hypothetical protein KVR01_003772 [Diaporthe batatas]|uniref:uncharacterized protein n=1 Tax=Diaporthe batatas TaxID=748121 RepID=UPI001D05A34F|nr:uncharacterized protein KVR01_003772 [Diaporthe batatas]KAG8168083.1 hypothetical protein KVR01_003772 [Diaporthe batatas]
MDVGKPPQKGPEFCHIEASQSDESVQPVIEYVKEILKPLSSAGTPEPDLIRITLELPSVNYYLHSKAPLPKELLKMYSLRKQNTPTKALFPAYLRLVAEKWDEVLLMEEKEKASAAE